MKFLKYLYFFAVAFLSTATWAQFGFEFDNTLPVFKNGNQLTNAWGGGFNYAQISDFDYDFDGDMDLFIFDRSSNNIRVLVQENTGTPEYKLAYNSKINFPSNLLYRTTLVDYNNDGKKDIFTYNLNGLRIYKNTGNATDGLQWELVKDLLYSEYPNGNFSLSISSSDIPAIIDVDKDGDVDILTFSQGGQHVEYHQNQSMDIYGHSDSLEFILMNECWGKFTEDVTTNDILLHDTDFPCTGSSIPNPEFATNSNTPKSNSHAGSTILALDYNNSGVLDLILGDVSYTNMNLLINGGSAVNSNSSMISVDGNFPSNTTPVDMQLFPAAYYVDVDFDNIKDLVVCTNAKTVSFNRKSIWFYKNNGSNESPNFIFSKQDLFQDQMIEVGTGSNPVLVDINEDGLEDLIVSNFFRYKPVIDKESTFSYYQNTGTASQPIFTFVDDNYLDLTTQNFGFKTSPTFGDIDNDGDKDMLLGFENGSIGFYQNNSTGSGSIFVETTLTLSDNTGNIINAGGYSYPQLFDLNGDNLLDLIIGNRIGEIYYYQNTGTPSNFEFTLITTKLGNIDVSMNTPDGYSTPHFLISEGNIHLFCGSVNGTIHYYNDIESNLNDGDSFNLVDSKYLKLDVEKYSSCFVNDIDNDGNLDLYVGQDLGGVFHFETDPGSSAGLNSSLEIDFSVFPNPADNLLFIETPQFSGMQYSVWNLNGAILKKGNLHQKTTQVDISNLEPGVYFITLKGDQKISSKKWIKQP